jgi:hypothetical protein
VFECSITFKVLLNEALTTIPWGRTNKYLRGRGQIPKKNSHTEKIQEKNIVQKLLKKKRAKSRAKF